MLDLDSMLKQAATAEGWTQVIHRCAWCQRIFDERGEHIAVLLDDDAMVVTDGICRSCGRSALAEISARRRRHLRAA